MEATRKRRRYTLKMRWTRTFIRIRNFFRDSAHIAKVEMLFTVGIVFLLVALSFFDSDVANFRTDAWTRIARLRPEAGQPAWPVDSFVDMNPLPAGCTPTEFKPSEGSEVSLTQTGQSKLDIEVYKKADSAGTFTCGTGGGKPAASRITFSVAANEDLPPPVLRFIGRLTIGETIQENDATPAMLESGVISMEMPLLIARMGRTETHYELDRGDRARISRDGRDGEEHLATSAGFIRLKPKAGTDREGFEVAARTSGQRVIILPYGLRDGESVAVAPDLLSRLQLSTQYLLLGIIGVAILRLWSLMEKACAGDWRARRAKARAKWRKKRGKL